MQHTHQAFDPLAEINGESICTILEAFAIKQQACELLVRHGLPAVPKPGQWYSWQAWLNVLTHLEEEAASTVYAAGLHVIDSSVWPPGLHTFHDALQALDVAFRANIRGQYIGYYKIEGKGVREVRIVCWTPNPVKFDCGIITGLVRKFKPLGAIRVNVEQEKTPMDSQPDLKWFRLTW